MTKNYDITMYPPTIQAGKVTSGDPIEFKEARNPSGCQVETVSPKKVLSSAPDSQNRHIIEHGGKADHWKMTTERQLSVFDLLGDDGPHDNFEESLKHEAHVAFAVEGLGKVGTETPVHSPQQPGRIFSYGSSSPLKAARQSQSSKNFNDLLYKLELEAVAVNEDADSGSFLEPSFCTRGKVNSFSKPRQKLSTAKEFLRFNSHATKLKDSFADDEIFYDLRDEKDEIWKATSNFGDDNFLDEDCDITWTNSPFEMDGCSADYWNLGDHEMSDFALQGSCHKKNRVTEKASGRFNNSDSPAPYFQQQRSKNDCDFISPDGTWYGAGGDFDLRDVTNQPAWSCYVTEDAGESLSLLSEESCSSSAVRGKATKMSPPNSVARQNLKRHGDRVRSPVNKCSVEKYAKGKHCAKYDDLRGGENINEPGRFTKFSHPSSVNPSYFSNTVFPQRFGPEDTVQFEEGYISADRASAFSSFCQTSGAAKRASADPKLWTEDPFGACSLPEVLANDKSSFEKSKYDDVLHEFSPSGKFTSEKLTSCESYSHAHSYVTPIFSAIGSGRSKKNLCMDSKIEGRRRNLFPVEGFQGNAEFHRVPVEETVAKDGETTPQNQPTNCVKLRKDICIGSNDDLSSENEQPLEVSDSKDNCSDYNEAMNLTPESENRKATDFPEHAEERSSSVKIPDKFDGSIDEKEYHNDAQTSLPRRNASTAVNLKMKIDDFGEKERKPESKGQNTSLDPSRQVMMLESYVLQLLCVQKVLKEASVHDTAKKV